MIDHKTEKPIDLILFPLFNMHTRTQLYIGLDLSLG